MEAVQVYKTEDGKMFDTAEEAASHENSVAAKAKEESFRAALMSAGYSSKEAASMYVRGARLADMHAKGSALPAPSKRTSRPALPSNVEVTGAAPGKETDHA